ncbi:hypothetical protein BC938DRAFT_477958, partial [Jimgerdemannia flammicorona]
MGTNVVYVKYDVIMITQRSQLGKKMDVMRSSLAKVEDACYAIRIRGSEYPKEMYQDIIRTHQTRSPAIEAVSFLDYLEHKRLIKKEHIEEGFKDAEGKMILGIADLTGELMRYAINSVGSGNHERALEMHGKWLERSLMGTNVVYVS